VKELAMPSQDITITGPDGSFSAYAAGSGPAIVVLQEIFGVNHVMRAICDDLAAQGWLAICPDLFWRIEPGIQITDKTDAEWKQAFDLFGKFDIEAGLRDIAATVGHARRAGTGKVGALGYCLGGQLAYLTACRTDCNASVGYYGVNIQNRLDEAGAIKRPLMLHVAGKDQYVPAEAQAQVHAALGDHAHATIHDYPERDHAFARVGGAHYHAGDADLANTRTRAFFQTHLT
jgi:carboxymethylenebutenolidase